MIIVHDTFNHRINMFCVNLFDFLVICACSICFRTFLERLPLYFLFSCADMNDRFITSHDKGPYHLETSPLICRANQLTGFYIIRTSAIKELVIAFAPVWHRENNNKNIHKTNSHYLSIFQNFYFKISAICS